jgi:hypothetical protein
LHRVNYGTAIPLPCIFPRGIKTHVQEKLAYEFYAVLLVAPKGKNPNIHQLNYRLINLDYPHRKIIWQCERMIY